MYVEEGFSMRKRLSGRTTLTSVFVAQVYIEAGSEKLDGFLKFQVLYFLYEAYCVSRLAAAEALEKTLVRMNVERRCFFLIERAQSLPVCPGSLETHIRGYHIVKIYSGLELGDKVTV
tara:strand:- start:138 stop:491 length:354 start_codon:yes stop_codon:yes gene_type:complete